MDAEGRIHNSPRPEKSKAADIETASAEHNVENLNSEDAGVYLTEEELNKKLDKDRKDHQPFYTWTDERGIVHNQLIPQVNASVQDESEQIFYDYTFIPPFRVSDAIRKSACCTQFSAAFVELRNTHDTTLLTDIERRLRFPTRKGDSPAFYFRYPTETSPLRLSELTLKIRGTDVAAALIVVDQQYKPLYFIPELKVQYHPESWKSNAFYETLISVRDNNIGGYILYFLDQVPASTHLEVEWH